MKKNNEKNASTKLGAGLVPKLRFPEFEKTEEWDLMQISSILNAESSSLALNKLYLKKSGYAVYGADSIIGYIDTFQHKQPYISIVKDGSGVGRLNFCEGETSTLGTLSALKSKDEKKYHIEWAYYLLNTIDFSSYVKGAGIPHIYYSDYKSQNIGVPKPNEQQKIAACLSSLDEVITAEGQKLEVLKEHKKGLLQGLFPLSESGFSGLEDDRIKKSVNGKILQSKNPQNPDSDNVPKLRFKEFEGSGEWVEKKLGDISENVMYGMNAAAAEFDGENKYLRITDIDENTRLYYPNPLTSPEGHIDEKYLVKVGDLLFARTGASVGKSYFHQKENGKIYFAGFLIRFSIRGANPYFIYLQTLTTKYRKWVSATSIRSGQPGINAEEYKSYPFLIPDNLKEQQKIASTLSSLDDLINAQHQKIEALETHRKGLLQGLFPQMSEL